MKALCRFVSLFSAPALTRGATVLSFLQFDLLRFRRRLVMKNLDIAFGETKTAAEKVAIGRSSVQSFMTTILEMLAYQRYPLTANFRVEGEEHIRGALAQKKGVYILCMHMSNFEAMAGKISQTYAPVYGPLKKMASPGLNRFIEEYRRNYGIHWIKREKKGDAYRAIMSALERNDICGFIFDQSRPGEPRLPFFGMPAKTNTSLAAFWRKTQSPVVPVYCYRVGFASHVLVFKPALELEQTENAAQDILDHSTLFNASVESMIREKPEQYFWLHDRWK